MSGVRESARVSARVAGHLHHGNVYARWTSFDAAGATAMAMAMVTMGRHCHHHHHHQMMSIAQQLCTLRVHNSQTRQLSVMDDRRVKRK